MKGCALWLCSLFSHDHSREDRSTVWFSSVISNFGTSGTREWRVKNRTRLVHYKLNAYWKTHYNNDIKVTAVIVAAMPNLLKIIYRNCLVRKLCQAMCLPCTNVCSSHNYLGCQLCLYVLDLENFYNTAKLQPNLCRHHVIANEDTCEFYRPQVTGTSPMGVYKPRHLKNMITVIAFCRGEVFKMIQERNHILLKQLSASSLTIFKAFTTRTSQLKQHMLLWPKYHPINTFYAHWFRLN